MSDVTKPIALDETLQRVAVALEGMSDANRTMTITAIADDSVSVTGQAIKVIDVASGMVYKTMEYNGQPITFDVPYGMSYKVVPTCTLAMHYCEDTPSGIVHGNTSVILTYKGLGTISTFPQLKAIVDAGLAKYVDIGQQVSFVHSEYGTLTYDVVDYDETSETITLLQHDVLQTDMQFDAPEAAYYCASEITAGSYAIKLGNAYSYFTLAKSASAGSQIRVTTSQFWVYENAYDTVGAETGIVSSSAISGATDLGTTGVGFVNHNDRINYGSNNYAESALGRWINSSAEKDFWTPSTHFDRPPSYLGKAGFLHGVPDSVLQSIDDSNVKCYATAAYAAPDSQYPKNTAYSLTQKFFLVSEKELYGSATYDDGSRQFDRYFGTGNSDKVKYYGTSARYWWMRSPHSVASGERTVYTSGAGFGNNASNAFGVAPACKITKSEI